MAQAIAKSNTKADGHLPTVLLKELHNWHIGLGDGTEVRIEKRQNEMRPLIND